jgi:hypothetical protein
MTMDFADAMRAAMNLTRDQKSSKPHVSFKRIARRGVGLIQVLERGGDHWSSDRKTTSSISQLRS